MLLLDLPNHLLVSRVPPPREVRDVDKPVRDAADSRDDHDRGGFRLRAPDQSGDAADALRIADGSPAELHHSNRRDGRVELFGRTGLTGGHGGWAGVHGFTGSGCQESAPECSRRRSRKQKNPDLSRGRGGVASWLDP